MIKSAKARMKNLATAEEFAERANEKFEGFHTMVKSYTTRGITGISAPIIHSKKMSIDTDSIISEQKANLLTTEAGENLSLEIEKDEDGKEEQFEETDKKSESSKDKKDSLLKEENKGKEEKESDKGLSVEYLSFHQEVSDSEQHPSKKLEKNKTHKKSPYGSFSSPKLTRPKKNKDPVQKTIDFDKKVKDDSDQDSDQFN
jgi:hypothetical protein